MSHLNVTFLPIASENPYQKQLAGHLKELGVQVQGIGYRNIFLPSAVKQFRSDVLHLHWLDPFFVASNPWQSLAKLGVFFSQLVALKLMGVKIVWTVHNLKNHENQYSSLDQICTKFVARFADAVIAHCESAKSEVATTLDVRNRDKIFVVPHGNYIHDYENKIDREKARETLGISDSSVVFLFLGAIRPYKGVLELIENFKALASDKTQLIISGQAKSDELITLIKEKIEGNRNIKFIPGFVPNDQVQLYMNACDGVIFPYRDVLTSGAVLLAMSFGRMCIAPRLGCVAEALNDAGGFLYDPDSPEGLLQAMKDAAQNQTQLSTMGEYNRQRVEQWNWGHIADMTLNVYRSC